MEERSRSIRFVTGVIASSESRGNRSVKNWRRAGERCGSAAASHSGFPRMLGTWKIVGCRSCGQDGGELDQRRGRLGGQGQRTVVALGPLQSRGEGVHDRLHPPLGGLRVKTVGGKQVPAGLPFPGARPDQVQLDHPLGELRLGEAALDPLDRVLVRVEKQAAVP